MVKILRNNNIIKSEVKDLKNGDIICIFGKILTCTDESLYDDDEDTYYAVCGNQLYSEIMIEDVSENLKKIKI